MAVHRSSACSPTLLVRPVECHAYRARIEARPFFAWGRALLNAPQVICKGRETGVDRGGRCCGAGGLAVIERMNDDD